MIKNIPNKYNSNLMMNTIDINHKNVYDFFYLPIDRHYNQFYEAILNELNNLESILIILYLICLFQ